MFSGNEKLPDICFMVMKVTQYPIHKYKYLYLGVLGISNLYDYGIQRTHKL